MTHHETCQTIEVTVNGELQTIPNQISMLDLLALLGIDQGRVAVELNRSIVRQPEWRSTLVPAGAQLEIVQFVGGG